jgi:phage recombination protein Bet
MVDGKTTKTIAALPTTSNRADWSEDESAAIEAAGLVFLVPYGERAGERVLAPRAVVAQFLHLAERTGLDPLARQLYCIPRMTRDGIQWTIQTGIDGFRVVADRSKLYAGQEAPEWLTAEGRWVDVFVAKDKTDHPVAARVRVHRKDWDRDLPAVGIATWDEYAQYTSKGDLTSMWATRGPGQLAKCAEALALRKAFPMDLSGLYTADELGAMDPVDLVESDAPEVVDDRPSRRSRVQRPSDASGSSEAPVTPDDAETASAGGEASVADDSGDVDAEDAVECARCGTFTAGIEPGMICGRCEVEVEREIEEARDEAAR